MAATIKLDPQPRIAIEVEGQGPLVVCLHGIGGNRTNWRDQLPVLGAHFTAAAWDARGYGDSDDYDGPLDFGDFSADLIRVLDHFNAEKAHLVGLSMGGRIALDFYRRYPERVASLVLADTSVGRSGTTSPEQLQEFLRVRQRPLLEGKTPKDIAPEVAQTLVGLSASSEARQRVIESVAALHRDSYLKTLETVTRYEHFPPWQSIAVPCLVLVGDEDRIALPSLMESMAGEIPRSRFVVLQRTGHMSNIENPGEFNQAVLKFLLEHQSA